MVNSNLHTNLRRPNEPKIFNYKDIAEKTKLMMAYESLRSLEGSVYRFRLNYRKDSLHTPFQVYFPEIQHCDSFSDYTYKVINRLKRHIEFLSSAVTTHLQCDSETYDPTFKQKKQLAKEDESDDDYQKRRINEELEFIDQDKPESDLDDYPDVNKTFSITSNRFKCYVFDLVDINILRKHNYGYKHPVKFKCEYWLLKVPDLANEENIGKLNFVPHYFNFKSQKKEVFTMSIENWIDNLNDTDTKGQLISIIEGTDTHGRIVELDYEQGSYDYEPSNIRTCIDIDSFIWFSKNMVEPLPLNNTYMIDWVLSTQNQSWSTMNLDGTFIELKNLPVDIFKNKSEKTEIPVLSCPKVLIARFGASARMTMLLCFPKLRKMFGNVYQNYPVRDVLRKLYDILFKTAFKLYDKDMKTNYSSELPSSFESLNIAAKKSEHGLLSESRKTYRVGVFKRILQYFPSIIENNPNLSEFEGIYLHIHAKDLKNATNVSLSNYHIADNVFYPMCDMIKAFSQLDWVMLMKRYGEQTFFDIGFRFDLPFQEDEDGNPIHITGLWDAKKVSQMYSVSHLKAGILDKDIFSTQIGGIRSTTYRKAQKKRETPIIKAQTYSSIKNTTYSHQSRKGLKSFTVKDVLDNDDSNYKRVTKEIFKAFKNNAQSTFSARYEYRIRGFVFPTQQELEEQLQKFIRFKPLVFIDSKVYQALILKRLACYLRINKSVKSLIYKYPDLIEEGKVLVSLMNYLIKTLMSRPGDSSWDRELWHFFGVEENSRKYNSPYVNPGIINWRLLFSQQRIYRNDTEVREHLLLKPLNNVQRTLELASFRLAETLVADIQHQLSIKNSDKHHYFIETGFAIFKDYEALKILFESIDNRDIDGKCSLIFFYLIFYFFNKQKI